MRTVDLVKSRLLPEQMHLRLQVREAAQAVGLEGDAVYSKYFRRMPLKLAGSLRRFGLDGRSVLDVGSGWGEFLVHFGPGSVGLEVEAQQVEFSRALHLEVVSGNVEDRPELDRKFDVVWCSNLLEHLVAPHLGLLVLRSYLNAGGLALISIPLVPTAIQRLFSRVVVGFEGFEAENHVNAFTRKTMVFFLERAGFDVVESSTYLPPRGRPRVLARSLDALYPHMTFAAVPRAGGWINLEKRPYDCMPGWMANWRDLYD